MQHSPVQRERELNFAMKDPGGLTVLEINGLIE
jgi:hypothetical protein